MSKITQDYLRQILRYDETTGDFFWKIKKNCPKRDGMKAGNYRQMGNGQTYIYIMIDGKHYSAHRLAWLYMTGKWPKNQIDHIDGNSQNNLIENLRDVTCSENQKNRRINKTNKTGIIGVFWEKNRDEWKSYICINSKLKTLGYFKSFFEACCSRKSAENKYGYHQNHGNMKISEMLEMNNV